MKFKFETGEVIECNDENIMKLLRSDQRYTELSGEENTSKKVKSTKKTKEVE